MAGGGSAVAPVVARKRVVRISRIALIIGGVLFLSGQGFFVASFSQGAQGQVATIPPGPSWGYVYEIKVLGAGRVDGQFASTSGAPVTLYVFGERQFQVFVFVGLGQGLFFERAPSGSFSAVLPASGTYYLVLAHGTGYEDSTQSVRVSFQVSGVQPDLLRVGSALIAAGIAGLAIGFWLPRRRLRPASANV